MVSRVFSFILLSVHEDSGYGMILSLAMLLFLSHRMTMMEMRDEVNRVNLLLRRLLVDTVTYFQ